MDDEISRKILLKELTASGLFEILEIKNSCMNLELKPGVRMVILSPVGVAVVSGISVPVTVSTRITLPFSS